VRERGRPRAPEGEGGREAGRQGGREGGRDDTRIYKWQCA